MNFKAFCSLITIVTLLTQPLVFAQNAKGGLDQLAKNLKFEHFNIESGLSNNDITDIVQDSLGYIWIATVDGLNRYNGNTFTTYNRESDPENSLAHNFVHQLLIDNSGKVLIINEGGLNIYDPKTASFSLKNQVQGLKGNTLSSMAFGKQEELLLGIYGIGLQFYDPNDPNKQQLLSHDPEDLSSVSSNNFSSIVISNQNTIWAATFDAGLNKIDYNTKHVERVLLGTNQDDGSSNINCLYLDSDENLWVGTKNGIYIITKKGKQIHLTTGQEQAAGLSDNDVLDFEQDDWGNMWIGTRNGGLNILNLEAYRKGDFKKAMKWFLPSDTGSSVYNRTVNTIYKDRKGHMWLGTSLGVNFVNPYGNPIQLVLRDPNVDAYSISHNRIRPLAKSHNGCIWIGTDGGGLNLYNPTTGTYKHFKHQQQDPSSLSNNYILSLLEDRQERVWIGTYRGGLNLLDTLTGTTKKYLQGSVADGSDVRVIFQSSTDDLWVGTNRGGLFKYNEKEDAFDYIPVLGKMDIRAIVEDNDKSLWLATYGNGLIHFNPKTYRYTSYNHGDTPGFTSNIIYSLKMASDGSLLVGTAYGGLLHFFPDTGAVLNFTEKDGLSNSTINSMTFRNDHELWIGTYKGISYYNLKTKEIKNLNSYGDISHSDFNSGSALTFDDKRLYFGGNSGLFIIHPEKILDTTLKYPLVFENLKIFNKNVGVNPDDKQSGLTASLPYLNHINVDHDKTLLTIDYSTLKYPSSSNIAYAYKLEGFQEHWVNVNNNHSINLSKLPPGSYNLVVRGVINPGEVTSNELAITVHPPFWKTLPAYLIYVLLIVALIWGVFKYYSDRLVLKNSLLFEKKQRQLEQDLNLERIRFFTGFSHELKTPLSLIMAPVEELLEQDHNKQAREHLLTIKRNAQYLYQNIKKLLEFRKSEVGVHQLSIHKINLSSHLATLVESYRPIARSRGIELNSNYLDRPIDFWCDIEKIDIIIHNLLSNAFKHTMRGGSIAVEAEDMEGFISISVTDTGKGIPEVDLSHIFNWHYQSRQGDENKNGAGIGLALSKSFAELHHGTILVSSKENEGSKFILQLPKGVFLEQTSAKAKEELPEFVDSHKEVKTDDISWDPIETRPEPSPLDAIIKPDQERKLLLLIDDNKDILQFLASLLGSSYDLVFAENGAEGIDKAGKYVPDLIISDVMMPIKSGIDLCAELKSTNTTSHIPIILLTARANSEGITEGYEKGADSYVTKPFNPRLLKTRIKNLINSRIQLRSYFSTELENSTATQESSVLEVEKAFLSKLEQVILTLYMDGNENTIVEICSQMGMSRTSLYRKVKALTGSNINEFVRKVRLQKAVSLIRTQGYTISQASFEVGFKSPKYFRKIFKDTYGKLPSEIS